nr:unnamed protein product [Digitaria exilis]CAB3503634.1 unnamed protein product [Digitaria exilis]CAB3503641.1 unnamed protein product [Digitaria exilis]
MAAAPAPAPAPAPVPAPAPAPKVDELQPHPPKEQLPGVSFCITSPPPWPSITYVKKFLRTMRGTQGALLIASTVQIILGFSGLWRNVLRLLSPLSAVPLVALVGFGLYELGFPGVAKCVEVGLPELLLLVASSQYLPQVLHFGKKVFGQFSVLFTVAIVWLYAYILTISGAYKNSPSKTQVHCRVDRSGLISGAPWIRVPYPFQWGPPTFDAGEAFAMMMTSFIALVEYNLINYLPVVHWCLHCCFKVCKRYYDSSINNKSGDWVAGKEPDIGIGILLDSFFGTASGTSVLAENIGLLALTRAGSRRVVQISAGFMIFFSVLGKFGALFASIPLPIFAAMYCVFFAYVGAVGLSYLQFCNLNSFRTIFILGFSFFMGLSVPQYFNEFTAAAGHGPIHTGARWFNDMINIPFSSKPFVGGLVAYVLDNTIQTKDGAVRKDRGYHWWDKSRSFKKDPRSEEYYSLPLNKFFHAIRSQ